MSSIYTLLSQARGFWKGQPVRIKRVFNNNAVSAYRDSSEVVVFGKGVGFKKRHGDRVDPDKIEKIFVTTQKQNAYIENLLKEIPTEYVNLTMLSISSAEKMLGTTFGSSTFIAVLDHINFALNRAKKGQFVANPLLWEIRGTYAQEYRAALETLDIIEEETGIRLPPDEAGTIAIHYFNAQDPKRHLKSSYRTVELIKTIIETIEDHFGVEFDKESVDFNRLMTHLRFFAMGLMSDEYRASELHDSFLFDQISRQYPRTYECACRVRDVVREKVDREVGNEELLYLMIHIQRVVGKSEHPCKESREHG